MYLTHEALSWIKLSMVRVLRWNTKQKRACPVIRQDSSKSTALSYPSTMSFPVFSALGGHAGEHPDAVWQFPPLCDEVPRVVSVTSFFFLLKIEKKHRANIEYLLWFSSWCGIVYACRFYFWFLLFLACFRSFLHSHEGRTRSSHCTTPWLQNQWQFVRGPCAVVLDMNGVRFSG